MRTSQDTEKCSEGPECREIALRLFLLTLLANSLYVVYKNKTILKYFHILAAWIYYSWKKNKALNPVSKIKETSNIISMIIT